MISQGAGQKAKLLEIGEIYIPREIDMPCFASLSTAGPDSGSSSHAFQWGDTRVKLSLTKDPNARIRLAQVNGAFRVYLDCGIFIEDVKILPLVAHAPNQAFMNLAAECVLDCAFCAMPAPASEPDDTITAERVLKIIAINARHPAFEAVALTSGIPNSVGETNIAITDMLKQVREQYPNVPIGVEAYVENLDDIQRFKDAGATEMKINIETWPEARFRKMCPKRDFTITLSALEKAVDVFGRGKVTSNLIMGLGESDDDIIEGLKALAGMGVIPNLRGIRLGPLNREKLGKALGTAPEKVPAERLLALGKRHREILEMDGLTTRTFDTMCFTCRCCDIVPMADL